ncbi:hypothetical protein L226DRAFT_323696 [Lentinus tigrinus ALCF2SS1-7]|uniref:uncharacterized protein n=1 Tax=Lentinus tigrinus ALCF2SS1-7 TaxID=1328758 RepID=UPI001165FE24|nr:hypothetical protein L226DRAFT_323696 [Lentinus tigrinus ALCF2SS1-7]
MEARTGEGRRVGRNDLGGCLIGRQRGRSSASSGWKGPRMGGASLDLGAVPCCESHERRERAVRGTGKEGGVTGKRAARTRTGPVVSGSDKIVGGGVGMAGGAGEAMALFV